MKWTFSAQEIADARRALGYSTEHMGALFGVSAQRVAAWEAGTARIPFRHVRLMQWWIAVADRERAVDAASDLPKCEWVSKFKKRRKPRNPQEEEKWDEELESHTESCGVCQKLDTLVDERYSVPSYPDSLWMTGVDMLFGAWLPEWASQSVPFAIGFVIIGVLRGLVNTMLGVALAALAGAAIGLVWSAVSYNLKKVKKKARAAWRRSR